MPQKARQTCVKSLKITSTPDIAMHCTGQFDTRSAIGLRKAIEPIDPMWIEDPLTVRYSEAWLELKRSTRVPLLAVRRSNWSKDSGHTSITRCWT
jgi:L-alanine-DL-glutamate epimerase-like enolase superfamily enzyme